MLLYAYYLKNKTKTIREKPDYEMCCEPIEVKETAKRYTLAGGRKMIDGHYITWIPKAYIELVLMYDNMLFLTEKDDEKAVRNFAETLYPNYEQYKAKLKAVEKFGNCEICGNDKERKEE